MVVGPLAAEPGGLPTSKRTCGIPNATARRPSSGNDRATGRTQPAGNIKQRSANP